MADNFRFAQLQPYSLNGAGVVAGATSITLKSMLDIDGNALSMSGTFGSVGFGTLEPGNGNLEEQISFTGLVNNANGTVTLTGVYNVSFVYPYTQTSGLAKTHAGSTTFVISNTAGFYNQFVAKDDDGVIDETLTFAVPNFPRMSAATPLPTDQEQLATKAYVDSVVTGGAANATTSVNGLVQLGTQAQIDAGTALGGTGASLVATPATTRSRLLSDYKADTGAANAYVITPVPAITAYAVGQIFSFKATNTNTLTSTLNVSALGVKTIKKLDGATNLAAGDITAGQIIVVEYDGINFQMISSPAVTPVPVAVGNINEFLTSANGTTTSWGRPFDYQLFTGSGTWTKPTNLSGNELVFVQVWGAGGGGGGSKSAGSNTAGAGGGGGGYTQTYFRASDLGATVSVTIGAAGAAGGIAANGGDGGNTTFGSLVTGHGGTGGNGTTGAGNTGGNGGNTANFAVGAGFDGGAGSGSGTGASSIYGGGGGGFGPNGGASGGGGPTMYGGAGGGGGGVGGAGGGGGAATTYGGIGGTGGTNSSSGTAGTAPGGGGGGAGFLGSGAGVAGSTGARGECRVWTFL